MKKLTNFLLPVEIGIDLDTVKSIVFKFQQGDVVKSFQYPSYDAYRKGAENVVLLRWTLRDTDMFETGKKIAMDTFIRLHDSDENPWTEIATMTMDRTLFTIEEVDDDLS